ncbi:MAG: Slp family lipoprotein [Brevundimonas sp.]|uniref:Slp family lipoprotein n=1 Tax=Brevundimonas sp. TaxID=1871086 RepID=UPI00391B2222
MKIRFLKMSSRMNVGVFLSCAVLSGCVTSPNPVASDGSRTVKPPLASSGPYAASALASSEAGSASDDFEVLKTVSVAALSPNQGVEERHRGERIRWAGAVERITTIDQGVCLTILYARSGENGEPLWTNTPTYQHFEACAAGPYDPRLVHELTNVTIIGRISGTTDIGSGGGDRTGPVVQIENLFRWSDCLSGDDSPECKYGFLDPQTDIID